MFGKLLFSDAHTNESELIRRPRIIRTRFVALSSKLIDSIIKNGVGQSGSRHAVRIPIVRRNIQRFADRHLHAIECTLRVKRARESGIATKLCGIDGYRLLAKTDSGVEQMLFAMILLDTFDIRFSQTNSRRRKVWIAIQGILKRLNCIRVVLVGELVGSASAKIEIVGG